MEAEPVLWRRHASKTRDILQDTVVCRASVLAENSLFQNSEQRHFAVEPGDKTQDATLHTQW